MQVQCAPVPGSAAGAGHGRWPPLAYRATARQQRLRAPPIVIEVPVLIGTSGWQYPDWRGVLYPPGRDRGRRGLPQRLWLEHYASRFATVENNNAFYRLPARETFESWAERTPPDFVMAVKASRYLTHVRRLRDPAEPVARLLGAACGLGGKLGPILLQLPPTLRADEEALSRLDQCLTALRTTWEAGRSEGDEPRAGLRVAVEPRHDSWWTKRARALLAGHGAALSWADRLERPVTPLWRTASWGYLRLLEGAGSTWPGYHVSTLRAWAERIAAGGVVEVDVDIRRSWPARGDPLCACPKGADVVAGPGAARSLVQAEVAPASRPPQRRDRPLQPVGPGERSPVTG